MVADTSSAGSRVFPEIQICFRSSAPRVISPRLQSALLLSLVAAAAALAYLGLSRFGYEHLAAKNEAAATRAESARRDLESRIGGLRQALLVLARDRDTARERAAALADETARLRAKLAADASAEAAEATKTLTESRQALAQEQARRAALSGQLDKIEAARAAETAVLAQDKASLAKAAAELADLGAAHAGPKPSPAQLRSRLGEIWRRLSSIQLPPPSDSPPAVAEASPPAASPATSPPGAGIADTGDTPGVAAVEQALHAAGVDLGRVAAQVAAAPAEGGPFVPPPKDDGGMTDALTRKKLAAIVALGKSLPVTAPLLQYEIGSRFGPRIDPFNHRPAFHTGIDLDAPYSSPVYATAPGTVIYAGWLGEYGKAVEIDHGFGIVTLYGHLRRCLVAVGERVAAAAEIGLLGTTGRSTGPHVHYEVRVDGQPQDPEKFLGLAHLLPVAAAAAQLSPAAAAPTGNSR